MVIIPKEDCLDDICKNCDAHETCDLSTYRIDEFWDIEDMIMGYFECICIKGEKDRVLTADYNLTKKFLNIDN